ncbi:MAG: hypothetical protein AB7O96_13675 [Pseudobdellovibrionaceae bacterium]
MANALQIFLGSLLFLTACSVTKEKKDIAMPAPVPRPATDLGMKKRIVVLPFLDGSVALDPALKERTRKIFIAEANKTQEMVIVDGSDISTDFKNYIKDGRYDFDAISKKADSMGIHALMEGKILGIRLVKKADEVGVFRKMESTVEVEVAVRFAAVKNGKVLLDATTKLDSSDDSMRVAAPVQDDKNVEASAKTIERLMGQAFVTLIPRLTASMDKLVWEGRVAMVQGERIFLNVGRISGLNIGDIVKVNDEGDDVYDPQTGSLIGKVPGRLKGTLEVISYFGADGAITLVHSGSGFKENDRVELY